ncbi:hypothetical protein F5141DRAFT_1066733 [Pisolithus sp. B1]|nr:hypothetical protein F5141DRAFT_1066733 [Pisolithus sp. B1]
MWYKHRGRGKGGAPRYNCSAKFYETLGGGRGHRVEMGECRNKKNDTPNAKLCQNLSYSTFHQKMGNISACTEANMTKNIPLESSQEKAHTSLEVGGEVTIAQPLKPWCREWELPSKGLEGNERIEVLRNFIYFSKGLDPHFFFSSAGFPIGDYEGYESQSRHESSGQRGKDEGVPRFSGHPDDLIWFLEDVRDLCMQASCFEDHEWAQWCPAVCYLKHDLYNLVDKQKKVKINSCKALLNYRLCFTDIAAQLRISNQLSWIEKDDLFLEGEYADDPWPTCQVTREAERLLEEGYRFELREACLVRDQQSAREAQYEAEMQESRAARMEEQCRGLEKCSESARLGLKALQSPSSTSFKIQLLTHNSQDSSKLLKAPVEGSRGQAVEIEGIEVTSYIVEESLTAELQGECLRGNLEEQSKEKLLGAKASAELEIPPIELRDAEDKLRAEACAPEVLKPIPEPRGDLCEVPEQVGCMEVEEIKSGVEVERPSKVVAWRKPPEVKIRRKSLESVTWMIKEILPEFWITHSSSRLSGLASLLIYLQQGWTQSLGVETCATSPSALSQPAKRSGATTLRVNDARSLAPHTCSDAAMEIYASLSHKSENYLFEGYEILGGKVKAPHSGGWSTILEPTAISNTQKLTEEVILRVRTPQILCMKKQTPPCFAGGARRLLYGVLHQVSRLQGWGSSQSEAQGPSWHLGQDLKFTLEGALGLSRRHSLECDYLRETRMLRESKEVAKRSPSLDIRSSKNPSKVKRREE